MAMAEWWQAVKSAVTAYTEMTPAAFFTVVAVSVALYVAVSGLLARQVQAPRRRMEERAFQPLPPPEQLGEVTEEELRAYDGSDPNKPLLMAIKGQIYDVTQSRMFYGPGGPYESFAGRDASRALAKMSFEPDDLTGDISGLGPFEVEALQEWEYKFKSKYITVGTIKKTVPVAEGYAHTTPRTMTAERDINQSTIESNHEPEPSEDGAIKQGSVLEKTREILDADATTISHEDVDNKAKELLDLEVPSVSISTDALKPEKTLNVAVRNNGGAENATDTYIVEKPEETPNVALRNNSETKKATDSKGTPKPEDATQKPKEAPKHRMQSICATQPAMKMLGNQSKRKR